MTAKFEATVPHSSFTHQPFTSPSFNNQLNGSPFVIAQKGREPDQTHRQWGIAVPATSAWEPAVIRQLITSLFAIPTPLILRITASVNQITWYTVVPPTEQAIVARTLYAIYPQAELTPQPDSPRLEYYRYPLQGVTSFLFPLKQIEDFKAFDPLTTLLSAMRQLRPEESWVYELVLIPPEPIYLKLGQKLLSEWVAERGFLNTATTHVLEAKLNAPLKVVSLVVKIKANSSQRADYLAKSSWPTWMQFTYDGFNALAVPSPQTFQLVLSPGEVAALWHLPNETLNIPSIVWTQSLVMPMPESLKTLQGGIILGTNTYQGRSHPARLSYQDRDAHVTIIGTTGMGKSTLMHHMIHQDLEAGKALAVIDPHGDLIADILCSSIPLGRESDVVLFDTHDAHYPISLNPLAVPQGIPPSKVARQALDLIKKLCADDWPGAQTERYFMAALQALVDYPGATFLDIPTLLIDKAFRTQVIARIKDDKVRQTWLVYDRFNAGSQAKITEPILNRLDRFYSDPMLEQMICQPDSLDFRHLIDNRKIFLANLGAFQEEREANTLGALLLSKFQFAAMGRGEISKTERQQKTYYLYIDELQRFTTTSLPVMYDQARKYGLSLVGAFQRLSQMPGEDLKGIASGVGVLITFGTLKEDAKTLAPFITDSFTAKDLATLNKYTAIVSGRLHGQSLPSFSIQTQPPLSEKPNAEEIIARIRAYSRTTYGRVNDTPRSVPIIVPTVPNPNGDGDDPETTDFSG